MSYNLRMSRKSTASRLRSALTETTHQGVLVMSAAPSLSAAPRKVTLTTLSALRERGELAVFLTAYDYPTAVFADRAGVDMLLVGDSAAMTMLGHPNTLSITMTEMLVFARAVAR